MRGVLVLSISILALSSRIALADDFETRLVTAEAKWNAAHLAEYQFTVQHAAMVVSSACEIGTFTAEVVNDAVVHMSACQDWADIYGTVPLLFKFIRDTQASHPDKIFVEFDSKLGYPTLIEVDPDSHISDDEFEIRISNLNTKGHAIAPNQRLERP